jgi:hypothetical protein
MHLSKPPTIVPMPTAFSAIPVIDRLHRLCEFV